ncbi:ABC transporter permease [Aquihabitans sp. McL0605]|uniref:ABC transporter permease n=1 Tax=Aquihabitans sp. McL0605 TaxID=3415671 RepID=UPI003CE9B9B1
MTATVAPETTSPVPSAPVPDLKDRKDRRPLRSYWLAVWAAVVYAWLFAPIIVVVLFSFNDPVGKFNTQWNRFTLDNWAHPFRKADYTQALVTSLKVAFVACLVATVLGGLMALAISRYQFRGKGLVNIILVLPLTTPEIVMGSSLFTLFFAQNANFGFTTVVIAHILFCLSFVALTVQARVRGLDWNLEDAAMDLGSPPWRTFRTVTFPLILPGIAAAGLLSFALSIDDYIITSFVAGDSTTTFPMRIFNANKTEIPPQVHVIASAILIVTFGLITIGAARTLRRSRPG